MDARKQKIKCADTLLDINPALIREYNEILAGISSRVRIASARIRAGKPQEALAALGQLEQVLPLPKKRHWKAAKAAAARGRA